MILEIPTTLQDVSAMNNTMAKMVLETINHMLIELYATMAQAEIEKKDKGKGLKQRKQEEIGRIMVALKSRNQIIGTT